MTSLEDTFGEEFAQNFEEEIERRRRQRQEVSDEVKDKIATHILQSDSWSPEEPMEQYTTESGVTHDILLMEVPDMQDSGKSIWNYRNELDSGGVTLPLDYMGEWMSCLFNDGDSVRELTAGQQYLIIGQLDQWEDDSGDMNDQVSPVRGVMTLEELNNCAQEQITGTVNETTDDPDTNDINEVEDPEPGGDDEGEEDTGGSGFSSISGDEDDSDGGEFNGVDYETVTEYVESIAEHKEEVWELEYGDDELRDVAVHIMNEEGYEEYDDDVGEKIQQDADEYIQDQTEEEGDDSGFGGDEENIF
jgi:hypothetical protein